MNIYKKALKDTQEEYKEMMDAAWSNGHMDCWDSLRKEKRIVDSIIWAAEKDGEA